MYDDGPFLQVEIVDGFKQGGALIFAEERRLKLFTQDSFELLSNFHFVGKRKFHQNKL